MYAVLFHSFVSERQALIVCRKKRDKDLPTSQTRNCVPFALPESARIFSQLNPMVGTWRNKKKDRLTLHNLRYSILLD